MPDQGTLRDWNFFKNRVETDLNNKEYVGAHSVLIAAGPPELSDLTTTPEDASAPDGDLAEDKDVVYPIGIVQNATMQQGREVARLFEVGSKRSYFIPGRSAGSVSISRIMFHGRSLLRVLSGFYEVNLANTAGGPFAETLTEEAPDETAEVHDMPGSNDQFFIDIASDLFDRPIGLLFYVKNNEGDPYGQFYLENCFLGNHQFQVGAGSTILSESVSIQYDNLAPVRIPAGGTED